MIPPEPLSTDAIVADSLLKILHIVNNIAVVDAKKAGALQCRELITELIKQSCQLISMQPTVSPHVRDLLARVDDVVDEITNHTRRSQDVTVTLDYLLNGL